ncbi:MAG: HEPN domain-containing protein [Alphaproteobacteria bacterium]
MNADEDAERRREAARWMIIAREDMRVAHACLRMEPPAIGVAAYHSHQAAEKLLKGLLIVAAAEFRMTHDLNWLASAVLSYYPELEDIVAVLPPLNPWGVAYRYPGPEPEPEPLPSSGDIKGKLELMETLAARLRALAAG